MSDSPIPTMKELIDARRTPEFVARLAARMEQDKPILDRLRALGD